MGIPFNLRNKGGLEGRGQKYVQSVGLNGISDNDVITPRKRQWKWEFIDFKGAKGGGEQTETWKPTQIPLVYEANNKKKECEYAEKEAQISKLLSSPIDISQAGEGRGSSIKHTHIHMCSSKHIKHVLVGRRSSRRIGRIKSFPNA